MINEESPKITIREMRVSDVRVVMRLAQICAIANWSEESYKRELSATNSNSIIAISNLEIIGFAIAHLLNEQMEILNIAVSPDYRRQKIGEQLLSKILEFGRLNNAKQCWLEVREKNEAAQKFYLKNKFVQTGKRLNYYSNPNDNAVLMTLEIFEK